MIISNVLYYYKTYLKRIAMKVDKYIVIPFEGKNYNVDCEKLEAVLSFLENKEVIIESDEQLSELLKKYDLYNDVFLKNINNL